MVATVTVLILLSQLLCNGITLQNCAPNKQFFQNGLSCVCDSSGQARLSNCQAVQRGQDCNPGEVVQIGCTRCVCQTNGVLACDDRACRKATIPVNARRGLDVIGQWCTPFKSYYVDCSVCVCSASGKTSDAQCVRDTSCSLNETTARHKGNKNICLPKVTNLFPCLHCLCSDDGHFEIEKCVEICKKEPLELVTRCKPKKLFRKECNLCLCPDNRLVNDLLCSKNSCPNVVRSEKLKSLQTKDEPCNPHSFTKKRCIYCDCTLDGKIDEETCIEAECLNHNAIEYGKTTCINGEMVPICIECFCLSNATTNESLCSRSCSYQNKLEILEKVVQDTNKDRPLINQDKVHRLMNNNRHPNTVYLKEDKYCLSDDYGVINEQHCISYKERVRLQAGTNNSRYHNFSMRCEPSTFVEFECNTCFCSKTGHIDPKWCTYDDCESKKIIQASHSTKTTPKVHSSTRSSNGTCIPGTISKEVCNFCICPESGLAKDQACTKNRCDDIESLTAIDKFICEPLSYYEVDCNICYCPRNGLKNVSNCTKHICEKNFLRSNVCVPGQLFSDECNVCVCPPNGDKNDKACTNNTCPDTAWKKVLKMFLPIGNQIVDDIRSKSLDHCFPGEEFFMGCNLCVCPEMGLRSYATCNQMLCGEEHVLEGDVESYINKYLQGDADSRRNVNIENCTHYELPEVEDNSPPCTLGSNWRPFRNGCKQCLCPEGNALNFCRPLPTDFNCKENLSTSVVLFPQRRQMPYASAINPQKQTEAASNEANGIKTKRIVIQHPHTTYPCPKPGRVMDECYICDCEENNMRIVQEHCFKNEAEKCEKALATFLVATNKNLRV